MTTQNLSTLFLDTGDSMPIEHYRTLAADIRKNRDLKRDVKLEFVRYADADTMVFRVIALDGIYEHRLYSTYGVSHDDVRTWLNRRLAFFGIAL